MASVSFDKIRKRFQETEILRGVSLEVADREFMILVGPSGCGKSTLLRLAAGLEELTEGDVRIDGRVVSRLPPRDREIAMVFQDYALYPHMSVEENMSFGLRLRRVPRREIEARVREAAAILQIQGLLRRTPRQLSGGQRQRVAIGRAIVRQPKAFLFDEPLSNLDAKLREEMRVEIAKLHQRLGATIIYVTHDQVEAMTLGSRIAVMNEGVLQQVGPPAEVFSRPANLFVAGFIGSPTMNFVEGELRPGPAFVGGDLRVELPRQPWGSLEAPRPAVLGIRPEALRAGGSDGPGLSAAVPGVVEVAELLGYKRNLYLQVGGSRLLAVVDAAFPARPGERVELRLQLADIHLFDRAGGARLA